MASSKSLTMRIVIAMVLAIIAGFILNQINPENAIRSFFLDGVIEVGARVFLSSLKLLVVPLVFVSLVSGIASLGDIKKLGRLGLKTFLIYTATTALAIAIAIFFAELIGPGRGFTILSTSSEFSAPESPPLVDMVANIFPSNPFEAMVKADMLQIIVFSIIFGIGAMMSGEPGQRILNLFTDLNEVILKIVMILIQFAPYGVFCLLSKVVATQGLDAIAPMAKYFFTVLGVLFFHLFIIYGTTIKVFANLNPIVFFKKFRSVMLFAFSTSSSSATIPVSLTGVEKRLGVHNSVASFTIPFGATINMDGTAIMQGVATVFVSQVYGIELGLSGYLMVILTATLASIGTAAVPGVGLVMLAMVFNQVGLPLEGIGLILGVDRILDMTRTAVNVTGDAAITCVVAKTEGQFDEKIFYDMNP